MKIMAHKYREEIVGKRFLCVKSIGKVRINKVSEWEWRAGIVRAVTHKDSTTPDVLVRFYDIFKGNNWLSLFAVFSSTHDTCARP